jgi:hypothetical protein
MQAAAHAMTCQVLDHLVAPFFGFRFNEVADVGNAYTAPDVVDGFAQDLPGGIHQGLVLVDVFAQHKGGAVVRPEPIQFGRYIDVHQVAFFQYPFVGRDAVAELVVNADTGVAGKAIGEERRGVGAIIGQYTCAVSIQLFGAHAGPCIGTHFFEGLGNGFAGFLHAVELGWFGDGHN